MQRLDQTRSLLLLAIVAASGCAGGTGLARPLGSGTPRTVDPHSCGNYAATDAGRKLQAFLEATVLLERAVRDSEQSVRDTCAAMGTALGSAQLAGDTRTMCSLVAADLRRHLQAALHGGGRVAVSYQPAVCTVDLDVAARAAAHCEARAETDIAVRCQGTCTGTCTGTCRGACEGTCVGSTTAGQCGGECRGTCRGTCEGRCSGGCRGHADVQAEAACQAEAEVRANVQPTCTEPEVAVSYDAQLVADAAQLAAAVRAIEVGLPRLLVVAAKIGPMQAAFTTWMRTAQELAGATDRLVGSLGEQAFCVAGQIRAAMDLLASIQVSMQVQVEVSAEFQAAVGA